MSADERTRLFLALERLVKHQLGAWFKGDATVDSLEEAAKDLVEGTYGITEILEERAREIRLLVRARSELRSVLADINAEQVPYDGDDFHELLRDLDAALKPHTN